MAFRLFNKKDTGLSVDDKATVPFAEVVDGLTKLSPKAQVTFLFKLVNRLEKPVLKTLLYYVQARLKHGNAQGGSTWNKLEDTE